LTGIPTNLKEQNVEKEKNLLKNGFAENQESGA
jgi:hypothetical protein